MLCRFARLRFVLAATVVLGAACVPEAATAPGGTASGGRVVVERVGRGERRLLNSSARATYCASETTTVLVALDRNWAAGLALRSPQPVAAPQLLVLRETPGEVGTATAALRPHADSVAQAFVAVAGAVYLEAGNRISGWLAFEARDRDSSVARFVGRIRRVPVRRVPACSVVGGGS